MARVPAAANRQSLEAFINSQQQQMPAALPRMVVPDLRKAARMMRQPSHDFVTIQRPWDIQPVAFAPVLPGDSLMNMQLQVTAVTDPIRHRLSGWWMEHYVFYVKHSDLTASWAAIQAMHLTNSALGLADASARLHNYKVGTDSVVDWVKLATEECVRWYFRDGEEPLRGYGNYGARSATNDLYKCRVRDPMWLESVKIEDVNPSANNDLPGTEDFNDVFVPTAWATHYAQYEHMRQLKLIPEEATFEDFLETWGVKVPKELKEKLHRPELIRYVRNWQRPSNVIDPADGSAAAAVFWNAQARADKVRYFPEPGFILVLQVFRPKVLFGNQIRNASTMLDDAYGWLPAVLRDNAYTTLIEYDHNEGPLSGVFNSADDYWVDRRDLFIRGDQFINVDPRDAQATVPIVDLPKTAGADNDINLWYASDTDAQNLFVDNDDSDGQTQVRTDGVVKLNIKSAAHASVDHT